MRLNAIHVHHHGVLGDVSLNEIPRLSVVYGGNGSDQATLVRFLKAVLMDADATDGVASDVQRIGSIQISDALWQRDELITQGQIQ